MINRQRARACLGVTAILAASLWAFVPAVPASAATPSITVTPNSGLVDGQTVTVTGSNWPAGAGVFYCEAVVSGSPDVGDCAPGFNSASADPSGHFSVSVVLQRSFSAAGEFVDCGDPAQTCAIGAASDIGLTNLAVVNLNFAPQPPLIIPGSASVVEGNSGTRNLLLPVTLSRASTLTVTAHWQTPSAPGAPVGDADPATDFTAASGTVTFAPGATAATVPISINGDTLVERNELIRVTFSSPTNATILGAGVGFGTITNDDHAVVLPGAASVPEGNSGTTVLNVPVTLSNPSDTTITVQWFTGPAGNAPRADPASDFTAASGTVTFAPGQTAKTVPITINGDTLVEPNEWITISFNHPTQATMGGFYGLGFGIIANDD